MSTKVWAPYVVKSVETISTEVGTEKFPSGKSLVKLQPSGKRAGVKGTVLHEVVSHDPPLFKAGDLVLVTIESYAPGTVPFGTQVDGVAV